MKKYIAILSMVSCFHVWGMGYTIKPELYVQIRLVAQNSLTRLEECKNTLNGSGPILDEINSLEKFVGDYKSDSEYWIPEQDFILFHERIVVIEQMIFGVGKTRPQKQDYSNFFALYPGDSKVRGLRYIKALLPKSKLSNYQPLIVLAIGGCGAVGVAASLTYWWYKRSKDTDAKEPKKKVSTIS